MADFTSGSDRVCLVVYPDDGWGILVNGEAVSLWGLSGTAECVTAFVQMGGFDASIAGMGMTDWGVAAERAEEPPSLLPASLRIAGRRWSDDGQGWGDYRLN